MAIVSVHKLARTTESEDTLKAEFTETYQVTVDDPDDRQTTFAQILTADDGSESIPQVGDAHEEDDDAICWKRSVDQQGFIYTVRVDYSTEKTDSPLRAPAELRWDARESKRPCTQDVDGRAIMTSAEVPPDPYPEKDTAEMTLTIVRNQAAFDPVDALTYAYSLSSSNFYGFLGIQCRMRPITATRVLDPFQYWKVQYVIDFISQKDEDDVEKGWTLRFLDAGLVYLVGSVRTAVTSGGQPATQPVPLDGTGGLLAVGSTDFHYRSYVIYPTVDWGSLQLEGL